MPRVLLAVLAGCRIQTYESGASEPIRVREGMFHPGDLPVDEGATEPLVINAAAVGSIVTQGQANASYSGLASRDAYSVGIVFPTVGTGYWVVPVDGPDVTQNGNLLFSATVDFTPEVPYGVQSLVFAAIDGNGDPGPPYETTLCILPEVANNSFAACDPTVTPQNAIVSLSWDTQVDLDLVVVTPEGKVVSSKSPSTALEGATVPDEVVADPTTGVLSRDSNADCHIDGIRLESLVFPDVPPAGEYLVFASLHRSCGESYVNYELALYRRVDADDGTHPVERTPLGGGGVLHLAAEPVASRAEREVPHAALAVAKAGE